MSPPRKPTSNEDDESNELFIPDTLNLVDAAPHIFRPDMPPHPVPNPTRGSSANISVRVGARQRRPTNTANFPGSSAIAGGSRPLYRNHSRENNQFPDPPRPIPDFFGTEDLDIAAMRHDTFTKVYAHTAKCDECQKRNKSVIQRCGTCNAQFCKPCLTALDDPNPHTCDVESLDWNPSRSTLRKFKVSKRTKGVEKRKTGVDGVKGKKKDVKGKGKAVEQNDEDEDGEIDVELGQDWLNDHGHGNSIWKGPGPSGGGAGAVAF